MVDSFIPATPGSGANNTNVETSQLTRFPDGTVIHRERTTIGDPANVASLAQVSPAGLQVDVSNSDILKAILVELRVQNVILAAGLNVTDDLDLLRGDASSTFTVPQ